MAARRRSRGLSMVELLVGTAVGLFVAAAGTALVADQLRSNKRLVVEARLMQDLRSAADVVARDLRRAGHWAGAASGVRGDDGAAVLANPYTPLSGDGTAADPVAFAYAHAATDDQAVGSDEQFGFRLKQGVVELQLGAGNWQALTDAGTLKVTAFTLTPQLQETSLAAFCSRPCAAGNASCPPRQQVRSFAIAISGQGAGDTTAVRSVQGRVRLRNDPVVGACQA